MLSNLQKAKCYAFFSNNLRLNYGDASCAQIRGIYKIVVFLKVSPTWVLLGQKHPVKKIINNIKFGMR